MIVQITLVYDSTDYARVDLADSIGLKYLIHFQKQRQYPRSTIHPKIFAHHNNSSIHFDHSRDGPDKLSERSVG